MRLGGLGRDFGKLGANGKATAAGGGAGTTGQPIGLLLALTHAS